MIWLRNKMQLGQNTRTVTARLTGGAPCFRIILLLSRTLPQHITDEHNGLSYTLHGDYYFPDLELPEQQPIGKWGRLHLRHLESNHPGHFQRFLFTGELDAYLHTVDEQASERFDVLMKGYAQSWSITEALKAEDPIKWVGLMNLARAEVEHNVMTEIICA